MRKKHGLLILAIITGLSVTAQTATAVSGAPASAKVVYAEAGGPGLLSINYDMRFSPTNDGFGFRAGFGGWSFNESKLLLFPLGVNYITSRNKRDYFEAGVGATIVSSSYDSDKMFRSTFGFLSLGYRRQPAEGGYFFKASIVPVFGKGFFLPYFPGVGFGYVF